MKRLACILGVLACGGTEPDVRTAEHPPAELFSEPDEYRAREPTAELGHAYFAQYGVGDPYGTGVAYPIYRALMAELPDALGADFDALSERFGFIPKPDRDAPPIGFHLTRDPITRVDFLVTNCQLCHAGRIRTEEGERVIEGLGNRRVRIHAYAHAFGRIAIDERLTRARIVEAASREADRLGLSWPPEYRSALVDATLRGIRERFGPREPDLRRLAEGLPGRVATIEAFGLALSWNGDVEIPLPSVIGWTRIPDVIGAPHRDTNSFDAASIGSPVALAVSADFAFGARPGWFDEHRHIGTSMHLYMRSFERELPFPGAIDTELAASGYDVFETRCSGCHGHYARPGEPSRVSYRERVIPAEMIGTDTARLDAVTPPFVEASNALPITRGLVVTRATGGWVPPVLVQVWARGQYGHNGQWPDLMALATPPDARPVRYLVTPGAPLDLDRVGQAWRPADDEPREGEYLYDGSRPGYGVGGHPFLSDAPPHEQRALLEYLKTL